MNISYLKPTTELIQQEISLLNQSLEDLKNNVDDYLSELLSYVLNNSGKRIRPKLVILGAGLGNPEPNHVRMIGMAVEMIHIATLVHDDVIDRADLRRGQKTVVSKHGADTAVLLGDYLYTLAFDKIVTIKNFEILQTLVTAASVMCTGEIAQMRHRFEFNLTEDEYYSFIDKKTACFFGASICSGALLAHQDEKTLDILEQYGRNLGIAFQITDDLLDLTGDEDIVGKTLHTDLINGKMTLPLIHYRDNLESSEDLNSFTRDLKNPTNHISELVDQLKDSGSIDYAQKKGKEYVRKALECLYEMPESTSREHLIALAEHLMERKA